jgi:NAD(P)H dehydrogenase (quinone)
MIVVTGANGRLGRAVAGALARRGAASKVVLTSRDPAKLADFTAQGFRTAYADYGDPESLRAAFAGAERVLMISMPGPVEERIPRHRNALDAARAAGIAQLIYTSRVNPTHRSLYSFAPIHAFSEDYIRELGLPATIVRNNEYAENVVRIIGEATDPDALMLPGATGSVPYIPVADIAKILARLLIEDGHVGKTYELNGPEAIGRDGIAALVARATGRPVRALSIDGDEFAAFMAARGRPPFAVEMVRTLHAAIDAGEFATIWPDAERLLGRPPMAISTYLTEMFSAR